MFNCLVFTWERNLEVTFDIFLVLVAQINILESYLDSYLFQKQIENVNLGQS